METVINRFDKKRSTEKNCIEEEAKLVRTDSGTSEEETVIKSTSSEERKMVVSSA